MNPVRINPASQIPDLAVLSSSKQSEKADGESFGSLFKSFIRDVNELQSDAADMEQRFLAGEVTDVHQVMLASEEASVAFELFMEIRNKLLESYREIIRTPV
jgi:flagellar hook-basal body complex protein FliE